MRTIACTIAILIAMGVAAGATPHHEQQTRFYRNTAETVLAPPGAAARAIQQSLDELGPRLGIEVARSMPVAPHAFTEAGRTAIHGILLSFSTMEGIQYWSASREEYRELFSESYRVAGPGRRDRAVLPDLTGPPSHEPVVFYTAQQDGTFGMNVYRVTVETSENAFLLGITNVTTMTWGAIPLVRGEQLQTFVLVEFHQEARELHFYGNTAVRVPAVLGLEDRARNSFYNRIVAMQQWFARRLEDHNLARAAGS